MCMCVCIFLLSNPSISVKLGVMLNNSAFKCRGHVIKKHSCEQFVPIEKSVEMLHENLSTSVLSASLVLIFITFSHRFQLTNRNEINIFSENNRNAF